MWVCVSVCVWSTVRNWGWAISCNDLHIKYTHWNLKVKGTYKSPTWNPYDHSMKKNIDSDRLRVSQNSSDPQIHQTSSPPWSASEWSTSIPHSKSYFGLTALESAAGRRMDGIGTNAGNQDSRATRAREIWAHGLDFWKIWWVSMHNQAQSTPKPAKCWI